MFDEPAEPGVPGSVVQPAVPEGPHTFSREVAPLWAGAALVSVAGVAALLRLASHLTLDPFLGLLNLFVYGPLLTATFLVLRRRGIAPSRIGIHWVSPRSYLKSVLLWFPVVIVGSGVLSLLQDAVLSLEPMGALPPLTPVMVLSLVVIAPVAEEILARGALFLGVVPPLSVWPATGISTLVFAVMHIAPSTYLPTAFIGLVLARLALKYRSIFPCIALHSLFNGFVVYVQSTL